jgi:hypothetical protein
VTTWDALVSTALIGTERRPPPATLAADVAGLLGAGLPPAPPELAVLVAAGVVAAYRRAGWVPPHHEGDVPEPAPPDDRPVASAPAVQLLELLLSGQLTVPGGPAVLAAEWLEGSARAGRRPPDRLLPALLHTATSDPSRRAATVAAGGPRLRWLAARNPDWGWATAAAGTGTGADTAIVWSTGDRDTRMRLLAELRGTDPGRGRALVEETWSGETGKDRAAIVAALATGLGPDDEAFLEAALDDRSKGVRQEAAQLLAGLPTSRLAARMAGRLRPLVSFGGRLRKKLEVALPEELDQAARRDGLVDTGAPATVGPRSWWLIQIVAATPLSLWTDHLGLDPATAIRLADGELHTGLCLAARRQRAVDWALALLPHHPDPALLAVLPPDQAGPALDRLLARTPDEHVAAVVAACPGPWSIATSRIVLGRLRSAKTTGPLHQALAPLAAGLHPATAEDVETWLDGARENRDRNALRGLVHTLSIRRTIAQEFSSS